MMEIDSRKLTHLILFGLLLVLSFLIIKPLLIVIFLGALLAYIFYPLKNLIQKKVQRNSVASIIVTLIVLIILIVPSVYFVKTLIGESYDAFIFVKENLNDNLFENCNHSLCNYFNELRQDSTFALYLENGIKSFTTWIISVSSDLLASVPIFILNLFLVLFTMYYFLKDGKQLMEKISIYISMKKKRYEKLLDRLKEIVYGVVYGYFLVALIQGALGALGFFIFGITSPLFWGLLMAILALIPYLGTGMVWVPASLFLLLKGIFYNDNILIFKGIALAVYSFLFVASLDNVIKPKLMGDKAGIHPAIIMIGIFGGLYMFGALGVIIGPLVLSLLKVILEDFLPNHDLHECEKDHKQKASKKIN